MTKEDIEWERKGDGIRMCLPVKLRVIEFPDPRSKKDTNKLEPVNGKHAYNIRGDQSMNEESNLEAENTKHTAQ